MNWQEWIAIPWVQTAVPLGVIVFGSLIAGWLTKNVLVRALQRALANIPLGEINARLVAVVGRFSYIIPALIIHQGIAFVPNLPDWLVSLVRDVAACIIIFVTVSGFSGALSLVVAFYRRRADSRARPIKGYVQVLKIVLYCAGVLLAIAVVLEESPLLLLSGFGAMAAILLLVFRDTILSLVASVQLTSNDMIRIGDWIEMPSLNADGDVIDIALHTVKVQNWDKTITTIPTHRLISESFKNWRGMQESGGRRIKRALNIDVTSIRFLTDGERDDLRRIALIDEYLAAKKGEIEEWNEKLAEWGKDPVNTRRVTNIGTFRAYVVSYLRAHPQINADMTLIVRQLAPGAQGLPLEIYCFTATTAWVAYEGIQSDIFDHLIAILPSFQLRLFQEPSGSDVVRTMEEHGSSALAAM
jgi:miniconductance mechanosensitive channel